MLKGLLVTETEIRSVELEDSNGSLDALQAAVGGLIETVQLDHQTSMYVHGEGEYFCGVNPTATAIAASFGFTAQPYFGPAVFLGRIDNKGDDTSLSDEALTRILAPFGVPLTGFRAWEAQRDAADAALAEAGLR